MGLSGKKFSEWMQFCVDNLDASGLEDPEQFRNGARDKFQKLRTIQESPSLNLNTAVDNGSWKVGFLLNIEGIIQARRWIFTKRSDVIL
jgi:hypothetical protein